VTGTRGAFNIGIVAVASAFLAGAVTVSYPYVDLSLNGFGYSASLIGANAAMPGLGWLLATPLMPWALRRFPPRGLMLTLLVTAAAAALVFPTTPDPIAWMAARFVFGGGCGMVFRLIEYWINAASPETHRARNVGMYSAAFGAAAVLATACLPFVGIQGWAPVLLILGLLGTSAVALLLCPGEPPPIDRVPWSLRRVMAGPALVAFAGILAFGLFEAVPYTLMPVYAVRSGLPEDQAVWTATAFLVGLVVLQVPVGILGDRFGKRSLLTICALSSLVLPIMVPAAMDTPEFLHTLLAVWGGLIGGVYTLSLALLADHFGGSDLAGANAVFGTLYAAGSLVGPPLLGLSMDLWNPQGVMVAAFLLLAAYTGSLLLLARRGEGGA
jgi:MFS family permease